MKNHQIWQKFGGAWDEENFYFNENFKLLSRIDFENPILFGSSFNPTHHNNLGEKRIRSNLRQCFCCPKYDISRIPISSFSFWPHTLPNQLEIVNNFGVSKECADGCLRSRSYVWLEKKFVKTELLVYQFHEIFVLKDLNSFLLIFFFQNFVKNFFPEQTIYTKYFWKKWSVYTDAF